MAAAAMLIACLGMGAVEPGGEIIDPKRHEQAQTERISPKPIVMVSSVSGIAQWRSWPQERWASVKEGVVVDGPAEFRTGPRSKVTLTVTGGQSVTIDRLGMIKLEDLIAPDGKVKQQPPARQELILKTLVLYTKR